MKNLTTISRHVQAGVGMIEVMIAVLVLAVGLLGIAALQAITLKNAGGSAERTQAIVQSYSMLDTLRLQKAAAAAGTLNTDYTCSTSTTLGTPGTVAGWLADLKQTVSPSACGKIACAVTAGGFTSCTVSVRWDDSRATGGSAAQNVDTTSRL